jgi:hypothetical protein
MINNCTNVIYGYFDANWIENFDRKSTINFCMFVEKNLVTQKSKKQKIMTQSSVEAVYRAMTSTASEQT